jgi:hypothetical protein
MPFKNMQLIDCEYTRNRSTAQLFFLLFVDTVQKQPASKWLSINYVRELYCKARKQNGSERSE